MTEADVFFERTAINAAEPLGRMDEGCTLYGDVDTLDEELFFDEDYADQLPVYGPQTKKEAVARLNAADEQFKNGQWHSLSETMSLLRQHLG